MKHKFLILMAAFFIAAAANAQSTVDSIAAKYKLLPMPDSMTTEQTFPVLGSYTLSNATDSSSNLTITMDPANKGIVWVEGLPQGRVKAYLKKSPSTYRILPQKTESGKQIPEGTLIFDPSTSTLNVVLGKAYNEADPGAVFAANTAMDSNTSDAAGTDAATGANKVAHIGKTKSKTAASKSKVKAMYYTATKVQSNMASGANSTNNMNSGTNTSSGSSNMNMNTTSSSTDSTKTTSNTDSTKQQ